MQKLNKEFFICEIEDKVCTVSFNRPPLNLFTYDVFKELRLLFIELEDYVNSDDVRAVVLTTSLEKAFSAGDDVKSGPTTSGEAVYENYIARDAMDKVRNFPAPVVSAVKGHTLGGGMVLAMMADYVVASDTTHFGLPEINFGMCANWGSTYALSKGYPIPQVKHYLITGESFSPELALQCNFIQQIVPHAELLTSAQDIAKKYAAKAPIGVRAIKAMVNNAGGMSADAHLAMENYLTRITFDSADVAEGVLAFSEKRAPVFTNK